MEKVIQKDPEEIIINLVKHHGFIRRKKLFEEADKALNDIDSLDEVDIELLLKEKEKLSLIKFNRILKRLSNSNQLKALKRREYERFGIVEKDKRASYITLAKTAKLVKHHDKVLEQLTSEDIIKKKNALIELESMMEGMILTPSQLDKLVNLIPKEENKLVENIIRIIYNSIAQRTIFPSDIERLKKNLIAFYNKSLRVFDPNIIRQNKEFNITNTKAHIIFVLGILGDEAVLKWLKEDVQRGFDINWIHNFGYSLWTVAKLIDDNRENLFEFQNSLSSESDIKTMFQIRKEAKTMMLSYDKHYPKYREKLES